MNIWQSNLFAFTDLAMRVVEQRPFVSNGHAEFICEVLQDVAKKKIKNILITIPPAHSKTFIVANGLIPFVVGNDPSCRAFYVSNKHDLAVKKTGEIKKLLTSQVYKDLFPKVELDKKGEGRMTFLNNRGYIEAKGLMSDITGDNADLIVLDDPVDASATKVEMDNAKHKIRNSILNRLRPEKDGDNYGFIIINQRTGEEDISHFFLENYDLGYHINLPFLEEEKKIYTYNDITLIRNPNVELNHTLISKDYVKSIIGDFDKNDFSKRVLETQYNQNPQPATGQLMKEHDFLFYDQRDLEVKMQKIFITCDTANKTGTANDYSVMCCWGWTGTKLLLLDMIRGKWEFLDLEKVFNAFYHKWKFGLKRGLHLSSIIIEDKASGTQLYQTSKSYGLPAGLLTAKQRITDKYSRYSQVGAFIGSQKVYLPHFEVKIDGVRDVRQEITLPFLKEVKTFSKDNTHKHDDICDCLFDACAEVYTLPSGYVKPFMRF